MLKEYHKIDLQTGERLDVLLFDTEKIEKDGTITLVPLPEDLRLGWDFNNALYNPIWDLTLEKWVESLTFNEILEPKRLLKVNELSYQCNEFIENGYMYNGDFFQFNMKDQSNFNQQLSLLLLDVSIVEIVWKTENNGVKVLTREDFIQTCMSGESHKRNTIGRYWSLKQYVLTHPFESVEELEVVDLDFVIPTAQ